MKLTAKICSGLLCISIFCEAQNTTATFSGNTLSGCAPLTVQFTNTSTNAVSYSWFFGNGNTSVLTNPANVYSAPGTYTVKLIAYGINNTVDSVILYNYINVAANPVANFALTSANSSCLDGNSFSFSNTSSNAVSYLWDFGDGNTSTLVNPTHSYSMQGSFTVKLLATNSSGCTDLKIVSNCVTIFPKPNTTFSVNTNSSCNTAQQFQFSNTTPAVNTFFWSFGDGNTSTFANPSHTYAANGAYTVSLITVNSSGCSDTLMQNNYITIGTAQASFTSDVNTGCAPLPVNFTCLNQNAVSWLWNFGDGNTSTAPNPAHTYQSVGNYNVTLTVTLQGNCSATTTQNSFISVPANAIPGFNHSVISTCNPYRIQFSDQSQNAVAWLWEFGDGDTSTLQNPTHDYGNGNFIVKLHAFNSGGCETIFQSFNPITVSQPSTNFSSTQLTGCAPFTTTFNNASTGTQWLWNFGDGNISTQQSPTHTYSVPGSYTVKLVAYNQTGCSDSMVRYNYINVVNPAAGYITPPVVTGCVPFTANFADATPGAYAWSWDFGDGNTSALQNPSHTYTSSGTFTVKLLINVANGCTQYYPNFKTFDVQGGAPSISFTSVQQCPPYSANFNASGNNISSWHWDFGDGNTSTLQNPVHTYTGNGFFTVKLTTVSAAGCMNSDVFSNAINMSGCSPNSNNAGGNVITVPPSQLPVCAPVTVNFYNILSSAASWSWNFGDNTGSTLQNPSHTYTTAGIFNVTLVGYYPSGLTDTVYYPSYLNVSSVAADFGITSNSNCQNNSVALSDSSVNAVTWSWDFGDNTFSTQQSPTHVYPGNNPSYSISLTAKNQTGCASSHAETFFQNTGNPIWPSDYDACAGQSINFTCIIANYVSYSWNFGDGNNSALINPAHAYSAAGNYTVNLTVTDANGCQHVFTLPNSIIVSQPVANFSWTMNGNCNSLSVGFTNLSTGTSLPLQYNSCWNFGDNTPNVWAAHPTHIYANPGTYQVTLTAYTNSGCLNFITQTITVYPVSAGFGFIQASYCLPVTTAFSDSSVNAVSWSWDFGDGFTSALQNPVHIYNSAPAGNITLVVTDSRGCTDTVTKPNIQLFHTNFSASSLSGCNPSVISFTDSSFNAVSWSWNFGDGNTSVLQNPQHIYTTNGSFTVTLIAQDQTGCIDTMSLGPIVINKPVSNFYSPTPANCAPSLVNFIDQSVDAASWFWDFGDGSFSTAQHPAHIYNVPGTYTVFLIVTNSLGCSDTLIRSNYISVLGPIASYTSSGQTGCTGASVQFSDLSTGAVSWSWNFGDGNISSLQNPSHVYQSSGQFSVSLIVADALGCSANYTSPNPIAINPPTPPPVCEIIVATVISNNSVNITWNASSATNFSHYTVFRKDLVSGLFNTIGTVTAQNIVSFTDNTVNTLQHSYCYKVQTSDLCGNALPLDSSAEHCTINVTAVGVGQSVYVNWNFYSGVTVNHYQVYRMTQGNTAPSLIATVSSTVNSITDSGMYCPEYFSYRIKACGLNGNFISSNSDTSIAAPAISLIGNQVVDVVRSTVIENKFVLTEWKAPQVLPQAVVSYTIYRSVDKIHFELIANVPAQAFSYIDSAADVQNQNYYYKIEAENSCGTSGLQSNIGSSILLEANRIDQKVELRWTGYEGWDTGADYYIIEKMNDDGVWELLKVVDGNTLETADE